MSHLKKNLTEPHENIKIDDNTDAKFEDIVQQEQIEEIEDKMRLKTSVI